MNLNGKIIVITGAGGALGSALTKKLACEEAARIFAFDFHHESLSALDDECKKFGGSVTTDLLDVRDHEAIRLACRKIAAEQGRIDVWVNNAGVNGLGGFHDQPVQNFLNVLEVNLNAVIVGSHCALTVMHEFGGGLIINVASVAGHVAAPFMSSYVTAKHGVVGFTRSLQTELHLENSPVKLLLVSPAFFRSQMLSNHASLSFPEWLNFLVSTPDKVAKGIITAIKDDDEEIMVGLSGQMMKIMHAMLPKMTRRSSRVLLAKSFSDFLWNRSTK